MTLDVLMFVFTKVMPESVYPPVVSCVTREAKLVDMMRAVFGKLVPIIQKIKYITLMVRSASGIATIFLIYNGCGRFLLIG